MFKPTIVEEYAIVSLDKSKISRLLLTEFVVSVCDFTVNKNKKKIQNNMFFNKFIK